MMLSNLYKLRFLAFGANPIKKLVFFGALLLFGFQGFGQVVTVQADVDPEEGQIAPSNSFTINVAALLSGSVTVRYEVTTASTAMEGVDFVALPGEVTIPFTILGNSASIQIDVIDDFIIEGGESIDIQLLGDPSYVLGAQSTAMVTIQDNDFAGFTLSQTALTTIENGGSESFAVVLTAEPFSEVVLNVVSGNPAEGAVSPATLTFIPSEWNIPQTVTVTPEDDNIVDGPKTYNITVSVDATISDDNFDTVLDQQVSVTNSDDDLFMATITATTPTATENPLASGVFTVSLDAINTTGGPITVNYTVEGTAISGSDFIALTGSVDIPNNEQSAEITLTPINDTEIEAPETVILTLTADAGYTIGSPNEATVTIISEDVAPLPVATITATTPTARENPLESGTFTVNLNTANATGSPIIVNYTVSGTATPGSDYTTLSGSVSILPNESSATISVAPINDTEVEVDEAVILTLATGPGYNIGTPGNATVSIISDDRASISINDVSVNEYEGTATFVATLSGSTPSGFDVSYTTANGTANAGSDFTGTSGTIPFSGDDGETHNIVVVILDDGQPESNETFFVDLTVSSNFVTMVKSRGTGTIVDNDNCVEQPERVPGIPTTFCNDELSPGGVGQDLNEYVAASDIPTGFVLIWSRSSNFNNMGAREDGLVFNAGTYYGFLSNGTCTSIPLAVNLAKNVPPSIVSATPDTLCGPGVATLRAAPSATGGSVNWYASATATNSIGQGLSYTTPNIQATTVYYVEVFANGCTSERVPVTATVTDPIVLGTTEDNVTACNETGEDTTLDLDTTRVGNGLATGVWSVVSTPSGTITIGADNIVDFEGATDGAYVFRLTTNTAIAPCVDESIDVTIVVGSCVMDSDGDGLMDRDEIALGLDPNNPDTDGDGIDDATEVGPDINNPLDSGGFGVIDALNPCYPNISSACRADLSLEKVVDNANVSEGDEVVFTITLTNLSPILVTNIAINELIDPNLGFQYVSHSTSKGVYDVVRGAWNLDEVLALEENTLTITAIVLREGTFQNVAALVDSFPVDADTTNNTARVSVTVGPRSNDECGFLFNQISPNGDGTNDVLFINCIDQYPNNSIQIYDRYGNEVFAARRYDNSWMGTGKNGNLPKGTYFYILDLGDGTEVRKGWIQIIR